MNNTFNEREQQDYQNNNQGYSLNNYNPNYQNNHEDNVQQQYYNPDYSGNNVNEEYESQQNVYQEENYESYQNDSVGNGYNGQQGPSQYDNNYNQNYQNNHEDNVQQQYYTPDYSGNNVNEEYESQQNVYQEENYGSYQNNSVGNGYNEQQDSSQYDNNYNQNYQNQEYANNYNPGCANGNMEDNYDNQQYYDPNCQNAMGTNNEYFSEQQNIQNDGMNYRYNTNQNKEEQQYQERDISEFKNSKTKKIKVKKKPVKEVVEEVVEEGVIAHKNLRLKAYLIDKIFFLIPVALFYFGMLHDRIMDTVDTMMNYDIDISNMYCLIGPVFSFLIVYELIYFVYYVAMVSFLQGQSLGKKICHLSITSVDPDVEGLPISVLFKREFVYKFLSSILFIGYIRSMFSRNGVTVHDKSSKTRVVMEEE